MKRVFLDTNVVIDILLEREAWMEDALLVLSMADRGEIEVYCSALSVATASYLMERAKMPHDVMIDKLDVLCQICGLTRLDASIVQQALRSSFDDFEDALQYFSARTIHAEIIITRNGKDFEASEIPIQTAADFLSSLQ